MRFEVVRAEAFGPLKGEQLELAPGMTVIHGPNEAGKSSWAAALYAGLAGRRRSRGRGTREQAAFTRRHRPWSGRRWSVAVRVVLDDGLALDIRQDLANGDTRVSDARTQRLITVDELQERYERELTTEGGFDGARLLGLNRDSARSTIFVAQADILRVLEEADSLQEFLQRAATSERADTTAEQALEHLGELRRERVGVRHIGNKPLRAAQQRLEAAQHLTIRARDQHLQIVRLLADQREAATSRERAEEHVRRLEAAAVWHDIDELEARLRKLRDHRETLAGLADVPEPADAALVEQVRQAVAALHARSQPPEPLDGPSAEDLAAQLAALPEAPTGDTEVDAAVKQARERVLGVQTLLDSHLASAPDEVPEAHSPVPTARLREHAAVLAAPPPEPVEAIEEELARLQAAHQAAVAEARAKQAEWDAARAENDRKREEYERALEQYTVESRAYQQQRAELDSRAALRARAAEVEKPGRGLLWAGLAALAVGLGLLLVEPVLGGVVAALGAVLALVAGLRSRGQASTPHPSPEDRTSAGPVEPVPPERPRLTDLGPRPELPAEPAELPNLRAQVAVRQREVEGHAQRVSQARAELERHGLTADPSQLLSLAEAVDRYQAYRVAQQAHERGTEDLARQLADRVTQLIRAIEERDAEVVAGVDPAEASVETALALVERYEERCRERAKVSHQASRREDVRRAYETRLESERAHALQLQEIETITSQAASLVQQLRLDGSESNHGALLRGWLATQDELTEKANERQRLRSLYDQLLDGETEESLQARLEELRQTAGERPDVQVGDVDRALATAREVLDGASRREGSISGELSSLLQNETDVAAAIEEEAAAERALRRVESLDEALELAAEELRSARERAHADLAPALRQTMQPWLPHVTGGHYVDLEVSPADLSIKLVDVAGARCNADQVSHGTMEQVYLLLRLALAQLLSDRDETAPMVLDDVTVQSDDDRTVGILTLLSEQAAQRQVILFTQEREVVDWAERNLLPERDKLIALRPDSIREPLGA